VIRQEISRILINMCNNSFYAAQEKAKQSKDPDFIPKVKISTHKSKRVLKLKFLITEQAFLKTSSVKYFNPFLPPSQLDSEQVWGCL